MKNCVKALRKARGLRQEDLAKLLGVSRQTIIAIENDKYDPTLALAMKLARLLDTPVESLFTLEDSAEVSIPEKTDMRRFLPKNDACP